MSLSKIDEENEESHVQIEKSTVNEQLVPEPVEVLPPEPEVLPLEPEVLPLEPEVLPPKEEVLPKPELPKKILKYNPPSKKTPKIVDAKTKRMTLTSKL